MLLRNVILLSLFCCQVRASSSFNVNFNNRVSVEQAGDASATCTTASPKIIECDTLILGAGPSGAYAAYNLANHRKNGAGICVVEKNNHVGGKIYAAYAPDGKSRFPVGGARIIESQRIPRCIARDLGIEMQRSPVFTALTAGTRPWTGSPQDFINGTSPYFDAFLLPSETRSTTNDELWKLLAEMGKDPNSAMPPKQSETVRAYAKRLFGSNTQKFMEATYTFRSDWDVDAKAYAEFLSVDMHTESDHFYPDDTTSAVPERLIQHFVNNNGQLYLNHKVLAIDQYNYDEFQATTKDTIFRGKHLLIGIPPHAFKEVGGSLGDYLNDKPQVADRFPVPVAVGTAWWQQLQPGQDPWWVDAGNALWPNPLNATAQGGTTWLHGTNRAYTDQECFNQAWIINNEKYIPQHAMRVVYDDEPRCASLWEALSRLGDDALKQELQGQLQRALDSTQFNNATSITVPPIVATQLTLWPDGWYFARPGTAFTNLDIEKFARNPIPGSSLCMIGEAFHPNQAAWMQGAFHSVAQCLEEKFGINPDTTFGPNHDEECTFPLVMFEGAPRASKVGHWPNERAWPGYDLTAEVTREQLIDAGELTSQTKKSRVQQTKDWRPYRVWGSR